MKLARVTILATAVLHMHSLDDGVDVGDLATCLDNRVLDLVNNRVGGVGILEPDDGGLGLVNGKGAGHKGEGGDEAREDLHFDRVIL